jgi:hypothetical protein
MFWPFSVVLREFFNKEKYSNGYLGHSCGIVEFFFFQYLPEDGRKGPNM